MYVDKKLNGITTVQTLSRANRTHSGKTNTFILDFENTVNDIKKAFIPCYGTTILSGEVDINKVYDLQNKINEYMLYNMDNVVAFNKFMQSQSTKTQDIALGRLFQMLRPVINKYKDYSENERYVIHDYIYKFNRTYSYVTQLVCLHDEEYQYTLYLIRMLPQGKGENVNIDDKIKLGYASLKRTFKGAILLDEKPIAVAVDVSLKAKIPNKKKDTLQNIIDKVNERFDSDFTDGDRVIIEEIYQIFMNDSSVKKFKKYAKDNSTEIFVKSLLPDKFKNIVTQCFLENNNSFQKLFNDPEFYSMVQEAMAKELYKSLRKD